MLNLNVNGKVMKVELDPSTPLLWALRDHLNLSGTKYGCGVASCGACTVHIDGVAVRACSMPVSAVLGKKITTIEGLSNHPLQKAWVAMDVPQCGYCQSGQIMSAAALLKVKPKPTRYEIITAMDGNICRCGTYNKIISAIELASKGA
jgi:isoquinoline 1-oxidoreductase subunit alpha